jgi:hypothetical protein
MHNGEPSTFFLHVDSPFFPLIAVRVFGHRVAAVFVPLACHMAISKEVGTIP